MATYNRFATGQRTGLGRTLLDSGTAREGSEGHRRWSNDGRRHDLITREETAAGTKRSAAVAVFIDSLALG